MLEIQKIERVFPLKNLFSGQFFSDSQDPNVP